MSETGAGALDTFFFWSSPEFGAKFLNEIELLSLTKLRKNILPLGICLVNKKSTPMDKAITITKILSDFATT